MPFLAEDVRALWVWCSWHEKKLLLCDSDDGSVFLWLLKSTGSFFSQEVCVRSGLDVQSSVTSSSKPPASPRQPGRLTSIRGGIWAGLEEDRPREVVWKPQFLSDANRSLVVPNLRLVWILVLQNA